MTRDDRDVPGPILGLREEVLGLLLATLVSKMLCPVTQRFLD